MNVFRLTVNSRQAVICATLLAIAFMAAITSDSAPAFADSRGELVVSPAYARVGDVVTVTVIDADVNTTVLNQGEATDFTGNPYLLPPGVAGEQTVFRVQNAPLADMDGDGDVDSGDITISLPSGAVAWVAPETGSFSIVRGADNGSPVAFTTTYKHALVDLVAVSVTSPSDTAGFSLTLKETAAKTQVFTATFKSGDTSSATNASNPDAVTRPVIKAANGQLINLEYADQSPLTLVTNSVLIDMTPPVVQVETPANGSATRNVSEFAKVRITDDGSGVDITGIEFHVDLDRDGVFDEPGETVAASPALSSAINQGWEAVALLPTVSVDGGLKWHATATDRAGNVTTSDADVSATGQQDHTFTVDTIPPRPLAAYLGSSYDDPNDKILTNQQKQMRVVFSEELDPASVDPKRFVVGASNLAASGVVYADQPDTVWLTFDSLSSVVNTLTVLPGAVKDTPGFPSEMYFIDPIDQLGPILQVTTDKAVTNGLITVDVTSEEALGSPPSLTINGVTYSKMIELTPRSWTLTVDGTTLAGAASGQGVKNIQVAGLDGAGNAARGGQSPEAATYPDGAVLFEFDSAIKAPSVVPGNEDVATSASPVIVVSYADELGEYLGDTHSSVTIVSAKLDGFDVTALMTAATSTSWIYQPSFLAQGVHTLSVQARDDAGNIHGAYLVRFSVNAPEPTATPVPTPATAPTVIPVETPGATPPAELQPGTTATPPPDATEVTIPSATAAPEGSTVATMEPTDTATPEPTATPGGLSEDDIQATVTAMRAADADPSSDASAPVVAADAGYTVFGCGLPAGNASGAVGDYAFVGVGLLGLVAMQQRKRLTRREPSGDEGDSARGPELPQD